MAMFACGNGETGSVLLGSLRLLHKFSYADRHTSVCLFVQPKPTNPWVQVPAGAQK